MEYKINNEIFHFREIALQNFLLIMNFPIIIFMLL